MNCPAFCPLWIFRVTQDAGYNYIWTVSHNLFNFIISGAYELKRLVISHLVRGVRLILVIESRPVFQNYRLGFFRRWCVTCSRLPLLINTEPWRPRLWIEKRGRELTHWIWRQNKHYLDDGKMLGLFATFDFAREAWRNHLLYMIYDMCCATSP